MQGTFFNIINGSLEWTKTILLNPFRFKKWVLLCLIAILAAEFPGCSANFNIPREGEKQETVQAGGGYAHYDFKGLLHKIKSPVWASLLILIGFLVLVLFLWINSRFSFIFLNSIVKNDASIKIPFTENKHIGNSLFKWKLLFLSASGGTMVFIVLLLLGAVFFLPLLGKILLSIALIAVLLCVIFMIILIHIAVNDIVLPIMYKDRIGIMQGLKDGLRILKKEGSNFVLYLLIKIGLRIFTGVMSGLVVMGIIIILLIQQAFIGGALYSVSFALSGIAKQGYFAILILLGIVCLFSVIFIINLFLLPVPVFFRTYSLKFLSRIDDRYDLFRLE